MKAEKAAGEWGWPGYDRDSDLGGGGQNEAARQNEGGRQERLPTSAL